MIEKHGDEEILNDKNQHRVGINKRTGNFATCCRRRYQQMIEGSSVYRLFHFSLTFHREQNHESKYIWIQNIISQNDVVFIKKAAIVDKNASVQKRIKCIPRRISKQISPCLAETFIFPFMHCATRLCGKPANCTFFSEFFSIWDNNMDFGCFFCWNSLNLTVGVCEKERPFQFGMEKTMPSTTTIEFLIKWNWFEEKRLQHNP